MNHLQAASQMNSDLENQELRQLLREAHDMLTVALLLDRDTKSRAPYLKWDRKLRERGIIGKETK